MVVFNKECEERFFSQKVYLKNERWFLEVNKVAEKLIKKDIAYVIIKGQAFSKQVYGKEGYRDSSDVDFLIDKKSVSSFIDVLKECGFEEAVFDQFGNNRKLTRSEQILFMNSHQTVPFYKNLSNSDKLNIDINTDILWGEYNGIKFDIAQIISKHKREIDLFGNKYYGFDNIFCFIEICLHHYKDMNAIYTFRYCNPFNLKMFQDIYQAFKVLNVHEKVMIKKICSDYYLKDYIYYMLFYTNYIYRNKSLLEYCNEFETDNTSKVISSYGLTYGEKKTWNISFEDRFEMDNISNYVERMLTEKEIKRIDSILSVWG